MKKSFKLLIIMLLSLNIACNSFDKRVDNSTNDTVMKRDIKVGVFDKNGDSPYCITDALEAVAIDSEMNPSVVSAADIMSGKADDIDVFIFPGGGGRSETASLGEKGQAEMIRLVREQGKAVIGICAGAYILSSTPGYPSLFLSGAKAIDIEHDHRGNGLIKFSLTAEGKKIFPELKDRDLCYSQYYEGPVLEPNEDSATTFTELATMLSDVHLIEGTPAKMTNNRPFIIISQAGKGKTASVVGHPESTPGMRWIIPRLVRVLLDKPIVSYSDKVVRPHIYKDEYLYTAERRQQQRKDYYALIGSKNEKIAAMHNIVNYYAWSAKKWIPPMVRDNDFEIRLLAAQMTVHLERTDAIADLEAAVATEDNQKQKALLKEQLDCLKAIRNQ